MTWKSHVTWPAKEGSEVGDADDRVTENVKSVPAHFNSGYGGSKL